MAIDRLRVNKLANLKDHCFFMCAFSFIISVMTNDSNQVPLFLDDNVLDAISRKGLEFMPSRMNNLGQPATLLVKEKHFF